MDSRRPLWELSVSMNTLFREKRELFTCFFSSLVDNKSQFSELQFLSVKLGQFRESCPWHLPMHLSEKKKTFQHWKTFADPTALVKLKRPFLYPLSWAVLAHLLAHDRGLSGGIFSPANIFFRYFPTRASIASSIQITTENTNMMYRSPHSALS